MSLWCLECQRQGAFNTLILFSKEGFDPEELVAHYPNYYTDCAAFDDFEEVEKSWFMVVETSDREDSYFTGTDGPTLQETKYKLISEDALAGKLPKIFAALLDKPTT